MRDLRNGQGVFPSRYGALGRLFNLLLTFGVLACLSSGPALANQQTLLLFGDSLTAGYGLSERQGFAAQLQRALDARGHSVEVINAGVSGDTSAGGLARLNWSLASKPTHALVELGANDALRGLSPAAMEQNLDGIISGMKAAGVKVLLAGMVAPRNLGTEYRIAFEGAYTRLTEKHGIALYPFFLEGLPGKIGLIQADGLHPNAAGVAVIVERIMPAIEALLAAGDST